MNPNSYILSPPLPARPPSPQTNKKMLRMCTVDLLKQIKIFTQKAFKVLSVVNNVH